MQLKEEIIEPDYRFKLKAKIHETGYKTMKEFEDVSGIGRDWLSRLVNGKMFPTPRVQHKLCRGLAITIRELKELL